MQIKLARQFAADMTIKIFSQLAADPAADVVIDLPDNWTTTPPTKPGWYWCHDPGGWLTVCPVVTATFETQRGCRPGDMVVDTDEGYYPVAGWAHYWLGPLPEPTPPDDDNPDGDWDGHYVAEYDDNPTYLASEIAELEARNFKRINMPLGAVPAVEVKS